MNSPKLLQGEAHEAKSNDKPSVNEPRISLGEDFKSDRLVG